MTDTPDPKPATPKKAAFPIAAPSRKPDAKPAPGLPDLHIEEIEERHVPKDRNIFDK